MWRRCLLLALGGSAVFADADIDVTETGPNEELAEGEVEIESAVISLQSKDFAQALQAHPLLMVRHTFPYNCHHSKCHQHEEATI